MTPDHDSDDWPEISIILIFWNEERFLTEAVESVLAQHGCRWELLLVDDGSTDASAAIALRYDETHPDRIRYVTHLDGVNRGMSVARNLGIAQATGRWLTFLDADDQWDPGKLEAQLDALDRHRGVEVLISPASWWYDHPDAGVRSPDWIQTLGPESVGDAVVGPPTLLLDFLEDEWRSICDLVISRDAVAAVGGYEPIFRGMYEDQAFHAKVLSRYPALVTSRSWYRYRQHPDACTATNHRAGAHLAARRRYLRWLAGHLKGAHANAELVRVVRAQRRLARYPRLIRAAARIKAAIGGP